MKALVKQETGVGLCAIAPPQPAAGEVLVEVALSGICRTDLYVAQDIIKSRTPLVLGHEFSGTVAATGSGVEAFKTGQRVGVMPLFTAANAPAAAGLVDYSAARMLGLHHDGSFAEYVAVPAHAVYALPDGMSFRQGAYLEPVAASLAVAHAQISPAGCGLIYGDNRIARLTQRCLQACGFDDIAVADGDLPQNHYDFIVETLATTDSIARMVAALKPGGRLVLKSRQHAPVAFNINQLVMKNITIEAVGYAPFQQGIDLIASGKLQVDDLFGTVYALEDFNDAFDADTRGESRKLFLAADRHVRDF